MTTCREPGCRRAPVYPGQSRCAMHRLPWVPEWVRRARESALVAKDYSGRAA